MNNRKVCSTDHPGIDFVVFLQTGIKQHSVTLQKSIQPMAELRSESKLKHEQVQYLEFLSKDIRRAKAFYTESFGWKFTDYGPDYTAFEGDYVDGGFTTGEPVKGSVLVILYSDNIEATQQKIVAAGGSIVKDIFSFPGGRRFHFTDPDGYELAVWSL
jgi:predicted enzyme related to lactoylglutathione lyase